MRSTCTIVLALLGVLGCEHDNLPTSAGDGLDHIASPGHEEGLGLADFLSHSGIEILEPPPTSVRGGQKESNTSIFAFSEKHDYVVPGGVLFDLSEAGVWANSTTRRGGIPAQTKVDVHFLHADRESGPADIHLRGTVTFDSEILGVIFTEDKLEFNDAPLGNPAVLYPIRGDQNSADDNRGLELHQDSIRISEDRHSLDVVMNVDTKVDQVRIVTEATNDDDVATCADAIATVESQVVAQDYPGQFVLVLAKRVPLTSGSVVTESSGELPLTITLQEDKCFIFIDPYPLYKYAHPVEYIFVHPTAQTIDRHNATSPPVIDSIHYYRTLTDRLNSIDLVFPDDEAVFSSDFPAPPPRIDVLAALAPYEIRRNASVWATTTSVLDLESYDLEMPFRGSKELPGPPPPPGLFGICDRVALIVAATDEDKAMLPFLTATLEKFGFDVYTKVDFDFSDIDFELDVTIRRIVFNNELCDMFLLWWGGHAKVYSDEEWHGEVDPLIDTPPGLPPPPPRTIGGTALLNVLSNVQAGEIILYIDACYAGQLIRTAEKLYHSDNKPFVPNRRALVQVNPQIPRRLSIHTSSAHDRSSAFGTVEELSDHLVTFSTLQSQFSNPEMFVGGLFTGVSVEKLNQAHLALTGFLGGVLSADKLPNDRLKFVFDFVHDSEVASPDNNLFEKQQTPPTSHFKLLPRPKRSVSGLPPPPPSKD